MAGFPHEEIRFSLTRLDCEAPPLVTLSIRKPNISESKFLGNTPWTKAFHPSKLS